MSEEFVFFTSSPLSCLRCTLMFEYLEKEYGYAINDYVPDLVVPKSNGLVKGKAMHGGLEYRVVETYTSPSSIVNAIVENKIGEYEKIDTSVNHSLKFLQYQKSSLLTTVPEL